MVQKIMSPRDVRTPSLTPGTITLDRASPDRSHHTSMVVDMVWWTWCGGSVMTPAWMPGGRPAAKGSRIPGHPSSATMMRVESSPCMVRETAV